MNPWSLRQILSIPASTVKREEFLMAIFEWMMGRLDQQIGLEVQRPEMLGIEDNTVGMFYIR